MALAPPHAPDRSPRSFPASTGAGGLTRRRVLILLGGAAMGTALPWPHAAGADEEIRYFRIGTAATTGTYFQIGGLIANAISKPPGARDCDRGGSCGVPGLVAVAQATQGSVENVIAVGSDKLESALCQSDVAAWAYSGTGLFKDKPPTKNLRAIAALFPESVHVVARGAAPIHTLKDLKGKRIGVGEKESGTLVDARLILDAVGISEREIKPDYRSLSRTAEALGRGELDAFFLFGGYPVPAIAELAASVPLRLIPIASDVAMRLTRRYRFFSTDVIPGATYAGVNDETPTISTSALWIVGAAVAETLVYDITKALWSDANRRILDGGHPMGKKIRIENALGGLVLPLHPGALRFYREAGVAIPTESQ